MIFKKHHWVHLALNVDECISYFTGFIVSYFFWTVVIAFSWQRILVIEALKFQIVDGILYVYQIGIGIGVVSDFTDVTNMVKYVILPRQKFQTVMEAVFIEYQGDIVVSFPIQIAKFKHNASLCKFRPS